MIVGHEYFGSKWSTPAHATTPLHGGAASGFKSMTHPHYQCSCPDYVLIVITNL